METFTDYVKRKNAETQEQLQKQAAVNADVDATALESAAIAATNAHAEATSGGMIDSNMQPGAVTAAQEMQTQQEELQPDDAAKSDWDKAQEEYRKKQEELDKETQTVNNQRVESFAEFINAQARYKQQQEEEMRAREKANTISTMATGATELAAGIVNLLSVGEGHASPQQYRSVSQDWMAKADRELREHRARRDDLRSTLDRLRMQQEELRANASLQDIQLKRQRAKEEMERARKDYEDEIRIQDKEWQRQRQERLDAASIANMENDNRFRWAQFNEQKRQHAASLATKGYNADGTPNATLMQLLTGPKSSGGSELTSYPILDANGNVNLAQMKPREMEGVLTLARNVIKDELGEKESKEFEKEYRKAMDAKEKDAVLTKWMAKSPSCGEAIRLVDANYRGYHGGEPSVAPAAPVQAPAAAQPKGGQSTQDLIDRL